jgi:hypothetical protein
MIKKTVKVESQKYYFNDTSFNKLMQKRIYKVLLICSNYDIFLIEEDGRIDEQIFNEYASLNLRYPPVFIQANTRQKAFKILEQENISLVIAIPSTGDIDIFNLSKKIKEKYTEIPIVVLTHLSRKVSIELDIKNTNYIDYTFCWLGNPDILLAIIKLIEDKMNAENDIYNIGVQAILLVENSLRYYSSYLPNIYKILFKQSQSFMTEGLNEHQKSLHKRGRPKILFATNYEEAITLYEKYKENILGIISDIKYKKNGETDSQAGIKLYKEIKNDNKYIPFILQSLDIENKKIADSFNIGFINKNSKILSIELENYFYKYFVFGDFVFIDPNTSKEIDRVSDLQSLQQKILTIPDESIRHHINKNDFSRWLNARALFPIAKMLEPLKSKDFNNIGEVRDYIFDIISKFRQNKGHGIIAKFDKNSFDKYSIFSRIGDGSIGGKARGLAFVDSFIKRNRIFDKYDDLFITIPRTIVLCTDIFDEFMKKNNLYEIGLSDLSDEEILKYFVKAKLPDRIYKDLFAILSVFKRPIAVRSSSLLEDSQYQPFAGIYSTYMIPKIETNKKLMIKLLTNAIKSVYASVFYKSSKSYMLATSNVIDHEKMGIIIQEVCGKRYNNKFYPTISGVARSINFYPIYPEKHEDGIANIAFGLGKYVVDGGKTLRFSPKYPKKILQLSSTEMAIKDTQKIFYALDLFADSCIPSTNDDVNILKLKIKETEKDDSIKYVSSTYDFQNNVIRDGTNYQGKKIITFSNILNYNTFPLSDILQTLLKVGQKEMNTPVEIEFAVNLDTEKNKPKIFNFLQIRPIVFNNEKTNFDIEKISLKKTIIYSNLALGNGIIDDTYDFIYIKPETFKASNNNALTLEIEKINEKFINDKKNYILVGPGRWGSEDPFLGIPVKWYQISEARAIVEAGLENYRIEPSQGTHFFQNLTSFKVGYFTINPFINDGYYDLEYLSKRKAFYESEFIKHIRFNTPLKVMIDGRKNKGVILKPKK